jgi:hypothetical protein
MIKWLWKTKETWQSENDIALSLVEQKYIQLANKKKVERFFYKWQDATTKKKQLMKSTRKALVGKNLAYLKEYDVWTEYIKERELMVKRLINLGVDEYLIVENKITVNSK